MQSNWKIVHSRKSLDWAGLSENDWNCQLVFSHCREMPESCYQAFPKMPRLIDSTYPSVLWLSQLWVPIRCRSTKQQTNILFNVLGCQGRHTRDKIKYRYYKSKLTKKQTTTTTTTKNLQKLKNLFSVCQSKISLNYLPIQLGSVLITSF